MQFVVNKMRENISEQIKDWKDINPVSVSPSAALMNRQCMHNVVEELKQKRAFAIMEVVGARDGIAHYLCVAENGDIYDPTLGWAYSGNTYKLVRYVHPEYDGISDMAKSLDDLKLKMYKMLPWHIKLLSKVTFTSYYDVF